MMYNEFVVGTGCKENEHNYQVFKNLEAMYMNTHMTKEEVYEYGRKLVDNSKSKEQFELEEKIREHIELDKNEYKYYKERSEQYKNFAKEEGINSMFKKHFQEESRRYMEIAKGYKFEMESLKTILD